MSEIQFIQEQINKLQEEHVSVQKDVEKVMEATFDIRKTGKAAHDRLDVMEQEISVIKSSMVTKDDLTLAFAGQTQAVIAGIKAERNEEIVKGLKWAMGIMAGTIIAGWTGLVKWIMEVVK